MGAGAAGQAYLITLRAGDDRQVALMTPTESMPDAGVPSGAALVDTMGSAEAGAPAKRYALTAGCFSKDGALVLVGTSRGAIHVLNVETQAPVAMVQLPCPRRPNGS